jgi:flagellar hook-associated protein 2
MTVSTISSGNVGSVSSLGVGSGLDANTIISKLMAAESQPLTDMQTQDVVLQTQVSTFGQIQSLFADLQTASQTLASPTLWNQTAGSSSDSTSVAVATSSGGSAVAGSYSVAVSQLASVQTATSTAFASSSSTLSSGSLTIELGTWAGNPATGFTAQTGATPVTVTIDPANTSLAAIRDAINAAGAGVTATIITDSNGARLSLQSSASGAVNGFRITATEDVNDGNPATGLSALGFDAQAASPMTLNQSAQDAQATINGIAITSASNTLTNVIDGLTITLNRQTSANVNLSVAPDNTSAQKGIDSFVSAYNALASYLQTQTKYDDSTKTAGPLQGNRTAVTLENQLRAVLNQASTASSQYAMLSDIGITMQRDGTLLADPAKVSSALANRAELKKLFAAVGPDNASSGFMVRFRNLTNAVLGTGGAIDGATSSLQSELKDRGTTEAAMQQRLADTQARLTAQYQALDAQMANLNSLSSYITTQIALWNKPAA